MPDPIVGPAVSTAAPTTSQALGPGAELERFKLEDLKAAARGSWPMSAQLDPKTFQRLEELAESADSE